MHYEIVNCRAKTNSSSQHRVVYTYDQTAILVPQTLPDNTTYIATTIGFKSKCATCDPFVTFLLTSFTKECMTPIKYPDGTLNYGSEAALLLNCSQKGIPHVNGTRRMVLCPLDANNICTLGWEGPRK